ncbi:hypothetical protein ACFORO_33215 [Amycolatopsis halotolerans]|uniref:Uncharacterized protein n=1 Tax=Amycolatopsis halotolerans TaxID=330083 RepID=A0ABV7QPL0_9PSEU
MKKQPESDWGAGALIIRRPEAGDSVLARLNVLKTVAQAALVDQVIDHLQDQEAIPSSFQANDVPD